MPMKHYLTSYQRRRRRRNLHILLALLIAAVAAAGCFGYVWLQTRRAQAEVPSEVSSSEAAVSSAPAESGISVPEEDAAPAVNAGSNVSNVSEPPEPVQPSSEPQEADSAPEDAPYDFSQPVPETDPVEDSYFNDALFIGDSRTQGFILYSGLSGTTSYADRGLSVDKVFTDKVVSENGADYTVEEALTRHSGEFQKVYLMFGINELGWNYPEVFQERYREVVAAVRESQPEAIIYVQSVLPVTREKSAGSDVYNMERVDLFNGLIQEMTAGEQVCYLDVSAGVSDEEGYLPDDASTDGVHLNKTYCVKWLDYLKNHALASRPSGILEKVGAALEEAQQSVAQS